MDLMHIQSKYVKYKRFNEYIWAEFCYTDKSEKLSLQKNYVEDIFVLSNILGRLEVYLLDKKDLENAHYLIKWWEKEFDERDYSLNAFKSWLNDYE
jgi:hypothetical protein